MNAGFVSFSLSFPNFNQNGNLENYGDRVSDQTQIQALPKSSPPSNSSNPAQEVNYYLYPNPSSPERK